MKEPIKAAPALLWFVAFVGILLIPFPYYIISYHTSVIQWLYVPPTSWIARDIFGINSFVPEISSDSVLMYVLMVLIILIAFAVTIIHKINGRKNKQVIFPIIKRIVVFYLALHLLKYGADKIFKGQFYLPEPNTLYTPLGEISRDLLLWSTLGTSYTYNLVTGSLEIIAAVLLIFRRTRIAGSLMSFTLLVNIVLLNFSFDISVKLFSLFLLFINVLILWPYLKRIARFFAGFNVITLENEHSLFRNEGINAAVKFFVVSIIIIEAVYPYVISNSFNDDRAKRPELHGAYEIIGFNSPGADSDSTLPARRIFVHREGYLIFQDNNNRQKSYKMLPTGLPGIINVVDFSENEYKLGYSYKDSILIIQYPAGGNPWLKARALNWRALPALKPSFHWSVDGDHAL